MTPAQAEARRRWFLENRQYHYRTEETRNKSGTHLHNRGYPMGDISCSKCGIFLNENNPFEQEQIRYGVNGKRIHKAEFCSNKSSRYPAILRIHGKDASSRRKRENEIKRY